MGYTHYFTQKRDFTQQEWEQVCLKTFDVIEYCNNNNIPLKWEYDSKKIPEVNNSTIRFNGVKNDGHETFMVHKEMEDSFNFCKTARKPYDLAVCLVLLVIKDLAPEVMDIGTDGEPQDWEDSQNTYLEIFSKDPPNIFVSNV